MKSYLNFLNNNNNNKILLQHRYENVVNHLTEQIKIVENNANVVSQENQFLKTKIITNDVSSLSNV